MRYSLFDRTTAWIEIFSKRDDLEFQDPLYLGSGIETSTRYPEDARAFASHASELRFGYHAKNAKNAVEGSLFLSFAGQQESVDIELDGTSLSQEDLFILEPDNYGTGLAGWYVLPTEGASFIVWSVEDPVVFSSLTKYLTEGARRAFSHLQCWQRSEKPNIGTMSLPANTGVVRIRAALTDRGTPSPLADDLVEWLGVDARLLLQK